MSKSIVWMTLLSVLVALGTANADLIVYDPFPIGTDTNTAGYYNAGADVGAGHNASVGNSGAWGGGGNWSGNWHLPDRWTVVDGTLEYARNGYALEVSGGRLVAGANKGNLHRSFASSAVNTGTLYASFLLQSSLTNHDASEYYGLTKQNNRYETARIDWLSNGEVQPVLETAGKGEPGTGATKGAKKNIPVDEVNFYVLKIEFGATSGAASRLTVWQNPGLGKTEAEIMTDADYGEYWSITRTTHAFSLQTLLVRHAGNSDTEFDEFRLAQVGGTFDAAAAWAAVTPASLLQDDPIIPEPVTGLALLGGLAAIAWRRRR